MCITQNVFSKTTASLSVVYAPVQTSVTALTGTDRCLVTASSTCFYDRGCEFRINAPDLSYCKEECAQFISHQGFSKVALLGLPSIAGQHSMQGIQPTTH